MPPTWKFPRRDSWSIFPSRFEIWTVKPWHWCLTFADLSHLSQESGLPEKSDDMFLKIFKIHVNQPQTLNNDERREKNTDPIMHVLFGIPDDAMLIWHHMTFPERCNYRLWLGKECSNRHTDSDSQRLTFNTQGKALKPEALLTETVDRNLLFCTSIAGSCRTLESHNHFCPENNNCNPNFLH